MKNIAILGSTGSIGTQALDVIEAHPDMFAAEVLTANHNAELLIAQARKFLPNVVVIADESLYPRVKEALADMPVKVYTGSRSLEEVVTMSTVNLVLSSLVGFAGLRPTLSAIRAGKPIALANKETLVTAGELVIREAVAHHVPIIPVDSEHSAIFQCLQGEYQNPIEKIILTASGGPFFGRTERELEHITSRDALKHPNWAMGNKVTIDSSTLMNKGFEVMEAKWLFSVESRQIDVLVHPQSLIHSMVQFTDGSIKAQLGLPDMRLPIQYALSYPTRIDSEFKRLDFSQASQMTFFKPDTKTFRCLDIALKSLEEGGNRPCIVNAANEVAVKAFLNDRIKFLQIPSLIEEVLSKIPYAGMGELEDYEQLHVKAMALAQTLIE